MVWVGGKTVEKKELWKITKNNLEEVLRKIWLKIENLHYLLLTPMCYSINNFSDTFSWRLNFWNNVSLKLYISEFLEFSDFQTTCTLSVSSLFLSQGKHRERNLTYMYMYSWKLCSIINPTLSCSRKKITSYPSHRGFYVTCITTPLKIPVLVHTFLLRPPPLWNFQ